MGDYSSGDEASLPGTSANLDHVYDATDLSNVGTNDTNYVEQTGSAGYELHQYKDSITATSASVTWIGKSSLAPSSSKVQLQVYRVAGTPAWEDVSGAAASNNVATADTDFTLSGTIATADYLDSGVTTFRIYQAAAVSWTAPNWTNVGEDWSPNPSYSSAQLFANPGFDADTDWAKTGGWTIGSGVASDDGTAGSSYLQQTVGTAGIWSRIGAAVTAASAGLIQGFTGYDVATNLLDTTTGNLAGEMINRVTTDYGFNGTAFNGSIDNAYAYNLTTADLFMIQDFGSQKNIASNITVPTATLSPGGVVTRMSDYNNFILAMIYYNGSEYAAVVYTVESGSYSRRISATITYESPYTLEIRFASADSAQMYFNGSTVGTAVDVTTMAAGTKAGGFGTRSNVSITAPVAS